jgi:hypothetical protein
MHSFKSVRRFRSRSSRKKFRRNTQQTVYEKFMTLYVGLKGYHFTTKIFNRHKAIDEFMENYSGLYDKFMESCMGHHGQMTLQSYTLNVPVINDDTILEYLHHFLTFLRDDIGNHYRNYPDLINIRDEMTTEVERLIYLLRLK